MAVFAVGDVVLIPFPYADFSHFKKRPALVVGRAELDNLILCQITSKPHPSRQAIRLEGTDFAQGTLNVVSYIRPDKLFTVEKEIVERKLGTLKREKRAEVRLKIRTLFS